jgi:hypothetical protein
VNLGAFKRLAFVWVSRDPSLVDASCPIYSILGKLCAQFIVPGRDLRAPGDARRVELTRGPREGLPGPWFFQRPSYVHGLSPDGAQLGELLNVIQAPSWGGSLGLKLLERLT